jgi:hypothetical protein
LTRPGINRPEGEGKLPRSGKLTTRICVVKTAEGRGGGTYAAKPLVYAYAMWISPKFHLHVIEAYDALVTGRAQTPPQGDLFAPAATLTKLLAAIRAEPDHGGRVMLYGTLTDACERLGVPAPPLAGLEATRTVLPRGRRTWADVSPPNPELAEAFMRNVATLEGDRCRLNHSRNPRRVAYSLPQVFAVAEARRITFPGSRRELSRALNAHPLFIGRMAVYSAVTGRTVKCWVFAAAKPEAPKALH